MFCVTRSVRAPMRAAASAASVPAWPPPTTMTSWEGGWRMGGGIVPARPRGGDRATGDGEWLSRLRAARR